MCTETPSIDLFALPPTKLYLNFPFPSLPPTKRDRKSLVFSVRFFMGKMQISLVFSFVFFIFDFGVSDLLFFVANIV